MQADFHIKEVGPVPAYTGDMAGRPPEKEPPIFGKRLADLRRGRGLTQQQLADTLGMTVKGIDYYERRAQNPSLDFARRAAKALNVSVAELLGEGGNGLQRKRGPSPKLQRQLEEIQRLPRSKQKFVSELLDTVLKTTA